MPLVSEKVTSPEYPLMLFAIMVTAPDPLIGIEMVSGVIDEEKLLAWTATEVMCESGFEVVVTLTT
jgi:hypothetical protein